MQIEQFNITGMSCGGCVSKVTRTLQSLPGVGNVKVVLSTGEVDTEFDPQRTSSAQLREAVVGAGYGIDNTLHTSPELQPLPKTSGCCN
jgi:copper chaperone